MTCPTPEQIAEAHYIPANNMAASLLVGGVDEALKHAAENADKWRNHPEICPVCRRAYADWYQRSCELVITRCQFGKKVSTDYPPLVLPVHPL